MKLEKIKLSGFKSFVDPTTIPVNGNLTAIVGPNGCGKSNIIDAVRWVMGESSAKHLRGGSMADVIFNGSSSRKPVSAASVELMFDNAEGKAGGEYAKYNSISLKRQVNRDEHSVYHLNGTRCRRRDITDLFLGTGLGSRSYAIIEQGTISRMVESKPDELRVHIEEAAGISKYKERRHETETRMRHTRENLERLDDLREEVENQLNHLKKQADKAEQYTELKQQERQYKQELLAMRWNNHRQSVTQLEQQLQSVAEEHNRLFVLNRELEKGIADKREDQKTQQEKLNKCQVDYYEVVSEISRLQQAIKHNEQTHADTLTEIKRLQTQQVQSEQSLFQDQQQLEQLEQSLLETQEGLESAREMAAEKQQSREHFQQERQQWQQAWERYLNENASQREQVEVQRATMHQLDNRQKQLQTRYEKLAQEHAELSQSRLHEDVEILQETVATLDVEHEDLQLQLDTLLQQSGEYRQQVKQTQTVLHDKKASLHGLSGKISSLELLQQHAMGRDNKTSEPWLQQHDLLENPRLGEFLQVEEGWETAVEQLMGHYFEAICVDNIQTLVSELDELPEHSVMLLETDQQSNVSSENELHCKIKCKWNLSSLLSGIFCADTLAEGRNLLPQLQDHHSVILRDGTRLGKNWLLHAAGDDAKAGVLQREKELRHLKQRKQDVLLEIDQLEAQLELAESRLKTAETERENSQQRDKTLARELSVKHAELSAQSVRHDQQQARMQQLTLEQDEIQEELSECAEAGLEAETLRDTAEQQLHEFEQTRQELESRQHELQQQLQSIEQEHNEAVRQVHGFEAQIQTITTTRQHTERQIERMRVQLQQTTERLAELELKRDSTLSPMEGEKHRLQDQQQAKDTLEQKLAVERDIQKESESSISLLSEQHMQSQRYMERQKEKLDKIRFQQQDSRVRQQTLSEQLQEIEADAEAILQQLSPEANEEGWKRKVDRLGGQIEQLGTINLTAIEEYQSQAKRLDFLTGQHDDLMDALNTLEQAIDKIDKESRQRFKATFDKINNGLQEKFPRLFGGGHAYLELTEQDLLETGVNIIARPPGKRNSSIHLLSGGEKALTAVALVFSIFELNPAPFCLLDEVDAPLDDANVVRFSQMVEDMSTRVQFLYISHNKVTMEIARQLAGVTMKEPGVSRMVAVDIEEAMVMAES